MPYGDSESNRYRINDLEKNLDSLRGEFLSFQNNINFEVSDLKSSLKYIKADIEKLVAKQAEYDKGSHGD